MEATLDAHEQVPPTTTTFKRHPYTRSLRIAYGLAGWLASDIGRNERRDYHYYYFHGGTKWHCFIDSLIDIPLAAGKQNKYIGTEPSTCMHRCRERGGGKIHVQGNDDQDYGNALLHTHSPVYGSNLATVFSRPYRSQ